MQSKYSASAHTNDPMVSTDLINEYFADSDSDEEFLGY